MNRIKEIIILLFFLFYIIHVQMLMQLSINQNPMHSIKLINVIKNFYEARKIESYNNSGNKLTNVKAALKSNHYSGYGATKVGKKLTNKKEVKTKKISRPKLSNAEFSAYSTN